MAFDARPWSNRRRCRRHKRSLQVGIIGASAETGWARESHVPAVQALSGLELSVVVTASQLSADKAATAFGARAGYANAEALFADSAIGIVTVAVKVPDHHDLALGALRAGKHVCCEWPLPDTVASGRVGGGGAQCGYACVAGLASTLQPCRAYRDEADERRRCWVCARCVLLLHLPRVYTRPCAMTIQNGTAIAPDFEHTCYESAGMHTGSDHVGDCVRPRRTSRVAPGNSGIL